MKLWSGRFTGSLHPLAARLNNSLPFDQRLGLVDVRGSQAWASALQQAGFLTHTELEQIQTGLEQVYQELQTREFLFQESDEDIHTAVERRLGELIGPAAGRLHTGRSRNDQVATDFRLWVLEAGTRLDGHVRDLQEVLIERAERDRGVILPGYTHTQQAQPILLSHWWLSHFWPLQRDRQRLAQLLERTRVLPLGSGALAGSDISVDRTALSAALGFASPAPNSLDAVSDRDFAVELLFWAALAAVHLSRLAEALILFSTIEFGFLSLPDAFTTGSSLMPQKRNPDPLELARGKAGTLIGSLAGLLATLKGLPSAYDKDLQEDKPPVFEACDTLELLLPVLAGTIAEAQVNPSRMRAAIQPQVLATDLAGALVRQGVPFREAHQAVGRAVRRAEDLGLSWLDLPAEEWQTIHPGLTPETIAGLSLENSLASHAATGGTAPQAVEEQIRSARAVIGQPA